MKRTVMTAGLLIVVVSFLSGSLTHAGMPGPNPADLWHYITKVSPYKEWSFWPDHQGIQSGRAPHGPLYRVYVNDRALNSPRPPVKYGSIQVKESYNKAERLIAITVMYKVPEYNPKDGDWFWVKYTPKGQAKPFGKPAGCIGCHGTRVRNDFILVHDFR